MVQGCGLYWIFRLWGFGAEGFGPKIFVHQTRSLDLESEGSLGGAKPASAQSLDPMPPERPAVKTPQLIMVFVTKFLSLGVTPSFTPFRIPASWQLRVEHY